MNKIEIIEADGITPALKDVLSMMGCEESNPAYEQIVNIFCEQKNIVEEIIKPRGAFTRGELLRAGQNDDLYVGRQVIYSMSTLGKGISEYIDECMKEDLMLGVLVDFMADSCVFSFDNYLRNSIKGYAAENCIGISRVYDAPNLIPIKTQKDSWEVLDAGNVLNVSLTSAYMLNPVKSNSHIFTISDNASEFNLEHDCSMCKIAGCLMRKRAN